MDILKTKVDIDPFTSHDRLVYNGRFWNFFGLLFIQNVEYVAQSSHELSCIQGMPYLITKFCHILIIYSNFGDICHYRPKSSPYAVTTFQTGPSFSAKCLWKSKSQFSYFKPFIIYLFPFKSYSQQN